MFCDTRYLLHRIATKVLCFCVISSFILLMCGFYFNMPSGSDCAVTIPTSGSGGLVRPDYNYEECLHRSEWVSEWVKHLHIEVPKTNFVSTLRVYHSFKNEGDKKKLKIKPNTMVKTVLPLYPGLQNSSTRSNVHKATSSQWLDSSVGRAMHRYRRSHGFYSRGGGGTPPYKV